MAIIADDSKIIASLVVNRSSSWSSLLLKVEIIVVLVVSLIFIL